jgi:hypothetical protein
VHFLPEDFESSGREGLWDKASDENCESDIVEDYIG